MNMREYSFLNKNIDIFNFIYNFFCIVIFFNFCSCKSLYIDNKFFKNNTKIYNIKKHKVANIYDHASLKSVDRLNNNLNLFLFTLINLFNSGYCHKIEYDNLDFNQRRRLIEDGPIIKTPDNQTLCQFQIAEVIANSLNFGTFLVNDDMPFYALADINNRNVILIRCMDLLCQQQNRSIIENGDDNIIFNNIPATLNNNIPIILYQTRNNSFTGFPSNTTLINCLDELCNNLIVSNISLATYRNAFISNLNNQLMIAYINTNIFLLYSLCSNLFCDLINTSVTIGSTFNVFGIVTLNNNSVILFDNGLLFCLNYFCTNFTTRSLPLSIEEDFDLGANNMIKVVYIGIPLQIEILSCLDFFCVSFITKSLYVPPSGRGLSQPKIKINNNMTYISFLEIKPGSFGCSILITCFDNFCNETNIDIILNTTFLFTLNNFLELNEEGLPVVSFSLTPNLTRIASCMAPLSFSPTLSPTLSTLPPSNNPTTNPSISPTINPSTSPTINPSFSPTLNPTNLPSINPTMSPTTNPSTSPSLNPTIPPSISPTLNPTIPPSISPTLNPVFNTINPSSSPTLTTSENPSQSPSFLTINPTLSPSTSETNNVSGLGIGLISGLMIISILLIIFCFEYFTNNKYQRI